MEEIIFDFAEKNNIIVGICDAERLDYIEEYLINNQVPFVPKEVEKRINPKLIMEDAQSIIVIGVSYNKKINFKKDNLLRGEFCLNAIGQDYHITVKNILTKLAKKLQFEIDGINKNKFNCKIFCDNADLIDRELAKKAGIGFVGRNTNIISEKFGSMFNIGYIITNKKLKVTPSTDPFKLGCYDCALCVKHCPSKALSYDEVKCDSTKCVSYITQNKNILTDDEIVNMGTKIYGCDICQVVCPHNKNVYYEEVNDIDLVYPELDHLLNLTKKEFIETYKKTSAGWRGKKLFKRNSLIALYNIGTENSFEMINEYKYDKDQDISDLAKRLLNLKSTDK